LVSLDRPRSVSQRSSAHCAQRRRRRMNAEPQQPAFDGGATLAEERQVRRRRLGAPEGLAGGFGCSKRRAPPAAPREAVQSMPGQRADRRRTSTDRAPEPWRMSPKRWQRRIVRVSGACRGLGTADAQRSAVVDRIER